MAVNLSLKLKDEVFKEAEKTVKKLDTSRNAYINDAVDFYNHMMRRKLLKEQIVRESAAVYNTSLEVLKEFENLDDEIRE
jgi:hypothetical protein